MKEVLLIIIFLAVIFFMRGIPYKPRDIDLQTAQIVMPESVLSPRILVPESLTEQPTIELTPPSSFPSIGALSVLVWEVEKEKVLFEKNGSWRLPIASLTKLMTALVVIEETDLSEEVPITASAIKEDGFRGELLIGDVLSVEQLIQASLITSSNDAASALAEYVGGKVLNDVNPEALEASERRAVFVLLMNRKAQALGMTDTKFQTVTGLDHAEQFSTAHDLMMLVNYLWRAHPKLMTYTQLPTFSTTSRGGKSYTWETTNELLKEVDGIEGGKTGFTTLAHGTLITLWQISPGRTLAGIILGSDNRFGEMKKLIEWSRL